MEDNRQFLQRDFLKLIEDQKDKEGIQISLLQPGTKLLVRTKNSFYEFKIIEGSRATVFGGTRENGTTRYPQPVEVAIHGSTWGGRSIKPDWIGQDMHLEFGIVGSDYFLTTTTIEEVIIESPGGDWSYPMNWNKEDHS